MLELQTHVYRVGIIEIYNKGESFETIYAVNGDPFLLEDEEMREKIQSKDITGLVRKIIRLWEQDLHNSIIKANKHAIDITPDEIPQSEIEFNEGLTKTSKPVEIDFRNRRGYRTFNQKERDEFWTAMHKMIRERFDQTGPSYLRYFT